MNDIRFACHHCGQSLEAPPDMAGTSLQCPSCGKDISIPLAESTPSNAVHDEPDSSTRDEPLAVRHRKARLLTAWGSLGLALIGWTFALPLRLLFFIASIPLGVCALVFHQKHSKSRTALIVPITALVLVGLGFLGIGVGRVIQAAAPSGSSSTERTASPRQTPGQTAVYSIFLPKEQQDKWPLPIRHVHKAVYVYFETILKNSVMILANRLKISPAEVARMNYWRQPRHVRGDVYEVDLVIFSGYDIYESAQHITYSFLVNEKTGVVNAQDADSAQLMKRPYEW